MLGDPRDQIAAMQNMNRLGAGAGFGPSPRAPLSAEALDVKVADVTLQIEELQQRRRDLVELEQLMDENPGVVKLLKLCQKLGFL